MRPSAASRYRLHGGGPGLVSLALVALLALLAAPAAMPSALRAQVVTGRVVDAARDQPVKLAELALLDTLGAVHDRTVSDHAGRFQLVAEEPGSYVLVATALGYRPAADGVIELGEGGHLPVTFYIRPRPIEVEGFTYTAERRRIERRLQSQGFYQREAEGFGHFITPEDIEQTSVTNLTELIARMPGVNRVGAGIGTTGLAFRRSGGPVSGASGYCTPPIWVDGARIATGARGLDLDAMVDAQDVVGVEVYTRASSAPLRYRVLTSRAGGSNASSCGAIVIWTK